MAADNAAREADTGLVREAAAELYAGDPAEFVRLRGDLAARARASGDAAAARAITGLRKPTRSAWVVNRLVRDDPGAASRLAGLGVGLREAGRALDGRTLRELSRQRRELIAALTGQALAGAGQRDAPVPLREEVAATLSAAVTDPEVAAELAAGALVRPVERTGFGPLAPDEVPQARAPRSAPVKPVPARRQNAGRQNAGRQNAGRQNADREKAERAERERAERAERERAARAERAEQERAEQERAQAVTAAEQAVREAEQAADAAQAAERDRADAVRRRERQLEEAHDALAAAKRESRVAARALRDARRALGRLRTRA